MAGDKVYAIFASGGKQYRVVQGDVVDVELLELENGAQVEFTDVLFVSNSGLTKVGGPFVEKALVRGQLLEEIKGPKVIAFKYKKRKGDRKKIGHRQRYARVRITAIES